MLCVCTGVSRINSYIHSSPSKDVSHAHTASPSPLNLQVSLGPDAEEDDEIVTQFLKDNENGVDNDPNTTDVYGEPLSPLSPSSAKALRRNSSFGGRPRTGSVTRLAAVPPKLSSPRNNMASPRNNRVYCPTHTPIPPQSPSPKASHPHKHHKHHQHHHQQTHPQSAPERLAKHPNHPNHLDSNRDNKSKTFNYDLMRSNRADQMSPSPYLAEVSEEAQQDHSSDLLVVSPDHPNHPVPSLEYSDSPSSTSNSHNDTLLDKYDDDDDDEDNTETRHLRPGRFKSPQRVVISLTNGQANKPKTRKKHHNKGYPQHGGGGEEGTGEVTDHASGHHPLNLHALTDHQEGSGGKNHAHLFDELSNSIHVTDSFGVQVLLDRSHHLFLVYKHIYSILLFMFF